MSKYNKELLKKLYTRTKPFKKRVDLYKEYCRIEGIPYTEKVRKALSAILHTEVVPTTIPVNKSKQYEKAKSKSLASSKRFIIGYAQNHTPVHKNLFKGIEAYSKEIGAEIAITAGIYNNTNSEHSPLKTIWAKQVLPYLVHNEQNLTKYLTLVTDTNVLPTAERPLRGFEGITGEESTIIGHTRQHFEVVPTLPSSKEKMLFTTGAVTIPNYRTSRVGKKAKFHHQMGFAIVEIFKEGNFVVRHVSAKADGSFQDLSYKVNGDEISKDGRAESLILGDLHLGKEDKKMLDKTESIIQILKPKNVVVHDILDGYSINHHASKDFVHQVISNKKNTNCLHTELSLLEEWVNKWKKYNLVIIPSNHNDWLDKWVRFNQGASDIKNATLFNDFQKVLYEEKAPKGLLAYFLDSKFKEGVTTLGRDDSYKVKNHELNNHGDLGANGAKGTPITFSKLNVKIVSGDKHTPYTLNGAYGVGISTVKKHGYNKGLSSWLKSHGVILENGKFQHLIYSDEKFTELL